MENGFIYPIFDKTIRTARYLTVVEIFKFAATLQTIKSNKSLSSRDLENKIISNCNIAIDLYFVFKWCALAFVWTNGSTSSIAKYFVLYMLTTNLYSYFYYHVWGSRFVQKIDKPSSNRRFLNAILAIAYYILCYAYLYEIHYHEFITWPEQLVDSRNAIYLSVANAFTLTYGDFAPNTQGIRMVFIGQLINTFMFFTIIINNSIPNHHGNID